MDKICLGVDPGANGGLVWIGGDGELLEVRKMPPTMLDILEALRSYDTGRVICCIEKVGFGMPGQSSKATATFARHCGHLEMALLASGISAVEVSPARWQRHFGLQGKKGEGKSAHKNRIKGWAQQRYPRSKVTLWASDALAIATYCYETRNEDKK